MPERTAPLWFRRKLQAVDRRLNVFWHDAKKRWIIAERVPRAIFLGVRETGPMYLINKQDNRVFVVEDLGTQILEWLRRARMNRFESVEKMVEELEIDKTSQGNLIEAMDTR